MRYQTVSHEELRTASRRQWDIAGMVQVRPKLGKRLEWPEARVDCLLPFAAAPTFAIMALFTGIQDGGMSGMLCSAAHDASPLTGMVPMYLLMSAFHLAPWLRLCRADA
jgi:hypothetical protein